MTEVERQERQQKYLTRKLKNPTICKICGTPVVPQYLPNGRLTSRRCHEECVISSAIQSILSDNKATEDKALKRAVYYGFTRKELMKIMKERSIGNG